MVLEVFGLRVGLFFVPVISPIIPNVRQFMSLIGTFFLVSDDSVALLKTELSKPLSQVTQKLFGLITISKKEVPHDCIGLLSKHSSLERDFPLAGNVLNDLELYIPDLYPEEGLASDLWKATDLSFITFNLEEAKKAIQKIESTNFSSQSIGDFLEQEGLSEDIEEYRKGMLEGSEFLASFLKNTVLGTNTVIAIV